MTVRLEEAHLNRLLKSCGHNSHSHLYYLGDKKWFWDSRHEAVIAYRTAGNRCIALGDPLGHPEACGRVIEQFIAFCRKHYRIPVIYQAKSRYLPLYASFGLQQAKIGEEARVDLSRFHMQGKRWLKLRNNASKFERGGYAVKVLFPPYGDATLNRLQAISDEWLDGRSEKSFSVGSFDPGYISRFPVAVLTGPDGRYEAFASIAGDLPAAAAGPAGCRTFTIDLMRYTSACPHGTMDFLFTSIFQWAQENGYASCSLGIAPLANMDHLLTVRLLGKYGGKLYNFKGLHAFKNKFAPEWEDVHIVCPPSKMLVTVGILVYIINNSQQEQQSEGQIS